VLRDPERTGEEPRSRGATAGGPAADAQPNDEALSNLITDIRKSRQDAMKDKGTILQGGLFSLARYGELALQ
jgi:hypothetical protein